MATNRVTIKMGTLTSLALGIALSVLPSPARAQQDPPGMARARILVNQAINLYRQQEYQNASQYFKQAESQARELTQKEQQDLSNWVKSNNLALAEQMKGRTILQRAKLALQQGRCEDAKLLLRQIITNQYLSEQDRRERDALWQQVCAQDRGTLIPLLNPAPKNAVLGRDDYNRLVTAGRSALRRGDLDAAQNFANEAKRIGGGLISPNLTPWRDNHTKLLVDIDTARKSGQVSVSPVEPRIVPKAEEEGDSFWPFRFKNWFRKDTPETPVNPQGNPQLVPQGTQVAPQGGQPPKEMPKGPALKVEPGPTLEVSPLQSMRNFFTWPLGGSDNDTQSKKDQPIAQGPPVNPPPVFPVGEPKTEPKTEPKNVAAVPNVPGTKKTNTGAVSIPEFPQPPGQANTGNPIPSGVVPAVAQGNMLPESLPQNAGQPNASQPVSDPNIQQAGLFEIKKKPIVEQRNSESDTRRAKAILYMKDAYKALDINDLETARRFATLAKEQKAPFDWSEQNPDRLLTEIQRRQAVINGERNKQERPELSSKEKADPRALVREARNLLDEGKYDDAERMINRAAALKPRGWGLFEDSPDRLRSILNKTRQADEKNRSYELLSRARELFGKGKLEQAKKLAYESQKLHGPYSFWDFGDRPKKLLDEIQRTEIALNYQKQSGPTKNGEDEPKQIAGGPNPRPNPVPNHQQGPIVSGTAQAALRDRALRLVREARDLQRQGKLAEAQAKAVEAQKLKAPFAPQEDSPGAVLLSLAGMAEYRVQQLLHVHSAQVANPALTPDQKQAVDGYLAEARDISKTFGLMPVEMRYSQTNLGPKGQSPGAMPGTNPGTPNPTAPQETAQQILGREKLDKARLELKAGNVIMARRLAEEALKAEYNIENEAQMVLRSIAAQEYNLRVNATNHRADAGIQAFRQGNFIHAAHIFADLELSLLSGDRHRMIREIMATREMQPEALEAKVDPKEPNKLVVPGQMKAPNSAMRVAQDNITEKVRMMQEINFQKLRDRGLAVQRQAMSQFQNDPAYAIGLLQNYINSLESQRDNLDDQRLAALRGPVDYRLQQYRTMESQRKQEQESRNVTFYNHSEKDRNKAIAKTQDQVMELLNRYRQFIKEGKLEEALAEAQKAKEMDPDNVAADAAIQIVRVRIEQANWNRSTAQNEKGLMVALDPNLGLPTSNNPLQMDPEGIARMKRRVKGKDGVLTTNRSQMEKNIERKLREPVNLDFKNTPLRQVIDTLQSLSGVNVLPDVPALEDAGVSLDSPMNLRVENMQLRSALKHLLRQVRLTYTIKDDALQITTHYNSGGQQVQKVYNVTDLVIPIDNNPLPSVYNLEDHLARHVASNNPGFSAPTPIQDPYLANAQTVSSPGSGQSMSPGMAGTNGAINGMNGGAGPMQTTIRKSFSNRSMEAMLINLITNTVAPDSWQSVGGQGRIQYYPLGSVLVVNQAQEVQEDIATLLDALRKLLDLQVAIEMRLVAVSESFYEFMGVDFDVNLRTPTSRREPDLVNGTFVPPPFVNRTFDRLNMISGLTPAGTLTPDLNIPISNSSFGFALPPFGGYPGTLGADGGLSLGVAFLNNIQVFMFMEAAQGNRRANVMQAPKVTVFNGQTAFITVSSSIYMLTGVQPVPGVPYTFIPQQTPLPIGVSMTVTPVVSADRRYVRLNLSPQMTNLISANVPLTPVTIALPSLLDGGVQTAPSPFLFTLFLQQPAFQTIAVSTTVNVPDGGTVLLGGLKAIAEARNEAGPPILSKIPYLSRLFRNVGYGRDAQSLLIMVTPRIIINEEEEQIYLGNVEPPPRF